MSNCDLGSVDISKVAVLLASTSSVSAPMHASHSRSLHKLPLLYGWEVIYSWLNARLEKVASEEILVKLFLPPFQGWKHPLLLFLPWNS